MSSETRDRIAASLARAAGIDASAKQIGDALVGTWRELEVALTPVLGRRGVGALYKRSVHLVATAHPWLPGVAEDLQTVMELEPLHHAVARQTSADAAAAGADLLQTFHDLLCGLVGSSLTERLLRSVWSSFSSSPTGQETSR